MSADTPVPQGITGLSLAEHIANRFRLAGNSDLMRDLQKELLALRIRQQDELAMAANDANRDSPPCP